MKPTRQMKISELDTKHLNSIKKLWEGLNALHYERSRNFKNHFQSFTFEERFKQLLKKENIKIFVADHEGENIGYCVSTVDDDVGEIESIYVSPKYQGEGVGKKLMQQSLKWLEEMGCKSTRVTVAEGNEEVFGFYNEFGFKKRVIVLQKL